MKSAAAPHAAQTLAPAARVASARIRKKLREDLLPDRLTQPRASVVPTVLAILACARRRAALRASVERVIDSAEEVYLERYLHQSTPAWDLRNGMLP